MFIVTKQAASALHRHLEPKRKKGIVVMRILILDGKWSWTVDTPRPDDELYKYDGVPVVAVNPNIAEALNDKTLDVRQTEMGTLYVLN